MRARAKLRPAAAETANGPQAISKWREDNKVHPAADIFPMMSDEELAKLGEDIKQNGIRMPIGFWHPPGEPKKAVLMDGRNRLEAAERVGMYDGNIPMAFVHCSDPTSWIISLNIHRRHLTKQQQADLIVAAIKAGDEAKQKLTQNELVSGSGSTNVKALTHELDAIEAKRNRGGRGRKNESKQKAIATGAKVGISKGTMARAYDKAAKPDGEPKRKRRTKIEMEKARADHRASHGMIAIYTAVSNVTVADFESLSPTERDEAE